MVVSTLAHASRYAALGAGIAEGLRFLREADLAGLELGRHAVGELGVFAIVSEYDTKPSSEAALEAHRCYFDIQYIVAGCEAIGYAPLSQASPTSAYDAERDIQWFAGDPSLVLMQSGMLMVLCPEDAHAPCIAVGESAPVRKVVVKAPVDPQREVWSP